MKTAKNKNRNSGHTPKWYGPGKLRTYCPQCPPTVVSNPTTVPSVPVGAKLPPQVQGKCGHTWVPVRG